MAQKQILIICGEPSGELHASALTTELKKINPELRILGVGSNLLAQAGAEIIYDTKGLSVMGLFDVLKKLPRFFTLKKLILKRIAAEKFNAIIFVDFSGFNLRLAKAINKNIPTIYYVSPQVWASRSGRVETIKKYISKMIVLFKFEQEFYKKHGLDVNFVGHPLLDIAKPSIEREEFRANLGLIKTKTAIALLPGSRKQEINKLLPVMLGAAKIIQKNKDAQFIIAKVSQVDRSVYEDITRKFDIETKIVEGRTYDCINAADFCLVCSGTATLETAILEKPFCLVYKMNLLNYLLYRPQVKLSFIGLVNIIANKQIIPEFIQFNASADKIAAKTLEILNNPAELERTRQDLAKIKSSLGENNAASRAARIIIDFLA